jgi:hypothetical protein
MTNADWTWVGLALGGLALWGLFRLALRHHANDTAAATTHSWAHIHKDRGTYHVYTRWGLFSVEKKNRYNSEQFAEIPGKWVATRADVPYPEPYLIGGYETKQECFAAIQKVLLEAELTDRQ